MTYPAEAWLVRDMESDDTPLVGVLIDHEEDAVVYEDANGRVHTVPADCVRIEPFAVSEEPNQEDETMQSEPQGYRVKIEQTANGNYTGSITGPGIVFPEIVWGETRDEALDEARKRVAWLRTKPAAETVEL